MKVEDDGRGNSSELCICHCNAGANVELEEHDGADTDI